MKHTPTPWHVVNGTQIRDELMPFDKDESWTALIATAASEHDSEFIVRACNSHDQLVAALKDAKILLELNGVDLKDAADYGNGEHAYQTVRRIHEALAAAGEQS